MNVRTRRSSNVGKDKSGANKKRKSITEYNIQQNTRGWKTSDAVVTNIGMIGNTIGKDMSNIGGGITSLDSNSRDLRKDSDDDESEVESMATKKMRSQYENMDFLVKSMLEMNDRMKRFEDSLKELKEEKERTLF